MTTLTAVSQTELIVKNNGRIIRIPVANLVKVDETVAACARAAVKNVGNEVIVPGDNRRPRNARVYGLLQ